MSLHLIRASAGTGKTEKLSQLVLEAVAPATGKPIRLEGLLAVTYTTKAAGELRSRLRRTLAKKGLYEDAQRLPLAYVGTVHAVCKRLLDEFAIAAGAPPALDVLPETLARRALAESLEGALAPEDRAKIDALCVRLQPNIDGFKKTDWMVDARAILELARNNRIGPDELAAMGTRAFEAYVLLACPGRPIDGDAADEEFERSLRAAVKVLGDGDGTDKTAKGIA
ncbi:MAG: UvrD-helicase domain-containing protein, partial [Polyangia bacterium]